MIEVENWFGYIEIQGLELMVNMEVYVCVMGIEIIIDLIVDLDFSKCFFVVKGDSGIVYIVDVVILVMGVQVKWFGFLFE